ncbi:elongation factor G [Desulfosarcina sp.]|uniref:elongation factor G n=1 Tax=Desulfosarcina sp. TaxID=2027861 RepID=UPI003970BE79
MNETLRNVALVAHGGSGKTSLAEIMINKAGMTTRVGRVEDGNTVMDFEPEELKRQASLSSGFFQLPWKKHTISLIDTPGDQNFISDAKLCMQAADTILIVVDAVDGVKVQTEQVTDFATEYELPCAIFINKLDRERADFTRTFEDVVQCLSPKPIIVQLPIGAEADFNGIVDLVGMKAYTYDENGTATEVEIPADMQEMVAAERETLIENVAEADDALIERYLEGETISNQEIRDTLKKGILARTFAPVLCGSATYNIGVDLLMDFMATCLPSPLEKAPRQGLNPANNEIIERPSDPQAPFSAFVFKTVADPYAGRLTIFKVVSGKLGSDGTFYNATKETRERFNQLLTIAGKEQKPASEAGPGSIVAVAKLKETKTGDTLCDESNKIIYTCAQPMPTLISFALESKTTGDEDKIYISLTKLLEEDIALKLDRNAETKEILISGLGQVHIESTIEKLKRKFNVDVLLKTPKIPYRETIKKKVRVQGKHKKQSGGHGQYGDCWIVMEPLPRGAGFEFVDAIVGGVIPKNYIPAVEKGIAEACQKGPLIGAPCVDFRATVDFGSYHAVDSSEMAFKVAGSLAYKKACEEAKPVLLEPIMKVTVITPDEYMGDIMGDMNSRRGRVLGMDTAGKNQVINAEVPLAEFQTYAPDLRSMTGGRGMYTMEFLRYDEVPAQIATKVIEQIKAERQ